MIVRIDLQHRPSEGGEDASYRVSAEYETLYDGAGFSSLVNALAAAVEGLGPEVHAAEIAFDGIVSGTYPLSTIATRPNEVMQHAVNSAAAVAEAEQDLG
ncbi:MAG TPA: hypothetical protein VGM74_12560 [Burkholderiaceae bacterium]|jgi:hypothetical protein